MGNTITRTREHFPSRKSSLRSSISRRTRTPSPSISCFGTPDDDEDDRGFDFMGNIRHPIPSPTPPPELRLRVSCPSSPPPEDIIRFTLSSPLPENYLDESFFDDSDAHASDVRWPLRDHCECSGCGGVNGWRNGETRTVVY
ncbi:hypothetical protein GQ43DRAFT_476317 [Delitschia confertaspora ATCC 74209]|uniref:Uncharacterized protein n=1 Tax=Delitschia confertaspora ATCC 74209 TaxID=1513339 RepID=A0A9P4JBV6_9PLEO|nr:hypothetical protein GQ43DRAFT_476317 [Delitschia confertaspora ATCC 74209]